MAFRSSRTAGASHVRQGGGRNSKGQFQKGSSVVIDGLDLIVTEFRFRAVSAPVEAGVAVVKHAGKVNERMRNRVPIGPDSWHVLNSLTADATPTIAGISIYADAGPDPEADEGAFVARFLEYGTVKQSPQPFIAPSADETMPEFLKDIGNIPR